MFRVGMGELLLIFLIVLLLFGAKRLPEIARSLGKAIVEFKKAGKKIKEDVDEISREEENEDEK